MLLLGIFVFQLFIHVVNGLGAASVNEILWILYNKLPTSTALTVRKGNEQRSEVLRLKREMNGVSAQDDFARWAKLRRQHDKAVAEYDKTAASLKASRSQFDTVVSSLRWLSTSGLRFFFQFWFARAAVYWIPAGWLPYYAEWLLSFPKAPLGSVSVQCWWVACTSIIKLADDILTAALVLYRESGLRGGDKAGQTGTDDGGKTPMAYDGGRIHEKKAS